MRRPVSYEESTPKCQLVSTYPPAEDQPKATQALAEAVLRGDRAQTLLGVTGSGKTMAMARIVEPVHKPTLVLCHNKALAAQPWGEFREFFPHNALEYVVSYLDYYQPEAYIAHTDTYIAKDGSINDEIDLVRSALGEAQRRSGVVSSCPGRFYVPPVAKPSYFHGRAARPRSVGWS